MPHLALQLNDQQHGGNKAGKRRRQRQPLVLHRPHQQQINDDIKHDRQQRIDGRRLGILQGVVHIDGHFLDAVKEQPQRVEKHNLPGALHIKFGKLPAEKQQLHKFLGEHHHPG